MMFQYADRIFPLGRELMDQVHSRPVMGPLSLKDGQKTPGTRSFPGRKVRLVCHEGKEKYLLAELALHNLDLVLSDAPIRSGLSIRAYNHFLGECGITFFAVEKNATRIKNSFPAARTMPPWS